MELNGQRIYSICHICHIDYSVNAPVIDRKSYVAYFISEFVATQQTLGYYAIHFIKQMHLYYY